MCPEAWAEGSQQQELHPALPTTCKAWAAPPSSCSPLCLHGPGKPQPQPDGASSQGQTQHDFYSVCLAAWEGGAASSSPTADVYHGQVQIFLRWPSAMRPACFSELHPPTRQCFFQYFALNLLLYLISPQQLFSTLTTNHKSISLCVRDCLCLGMLLSEGAGGCTAVCEPAPEHGPGTHSKGRNPGTTHFGSLSEAV